MMFKNIIKTDLLFSVLFGMILILTFSSCEKDDPLLDAAKESLAEYLSNIDQTALDSELMVIDDSLEIWGLTNNVVIENEGGVRYILHDEGSGDKPVLSSVITFNYSGKVLSTGFEFDAGQDLTAYLYQFIAGFQTTLPNIKDGSSLSMYIPSLLGYGSQEIKNESGQVTIPANSNLIFEVELTKVD